MTPETVAKLEDAFLMGCTDVEACLYADISKATLYRYIEENEEFRDRKESLKQNPFLLAKGVLLDALKEGDRQTAHKLLDRKEGSKVQLSGELQTNSTVEFINAASESTGKV
jgi:hypothetical protein